MKLEWLTIARKPRKNEEKTRAFSVRLLGFLGGDSLWDAPAEAKNKVAPIWIAFLGSEQELAPFTANFRGGQPAKTIRRTFQLPKKAPFRFLTHKLPGAALTVAYLPQLFHLETPGDVGERVRFVFAPPRWWVDRQAPLLESDFGDDARDVAQAALFAAYLDRRCSVPMLGDLRFQLRLYRAARERGLLASLGATPYRSRVWGELNADAGLEQPAAVDIEHHDLKTFLIEQTSLFFQQEIRHGQNRFQADRRVLPFPQRPALQLCFDFAAAG